MVKNITLLILTFLISVMVFSQETDSITKPKIDIDYTNKGFQFSSQNKKFLLHIESRLQFRFATPGDQNPLSFDEFGDDKTVFKINRARLKVGGNAFQPWLKYYWEYELSQGNLLDFRIMFEKWEGFNIKVGQWKTFFGRERVISSGKQQMVERSIINRPFTLDRQQGIEFYGRLFKESIADITYHASILTGTGRGSTANDDDNLLYVGRLQWNFLGRELKMISSDVEFHEKPTALIAFAAATNRSPYTRFSQSGGGQLEDFEDGVAGQYRVNQGLLETAFMYKGFSWQNEFHRKEIIDHINNTNTTLAGSYYQAGYFFSNLIDAFPEPLEVAARYARYEPDVDITGNNEEEYALAFNWFFKGHRNKLTAEVTYFDFESELEGRESGYRFRVQWDISL